MTQATTTKTIRRVVAERRTFLGELVQVIDTCNRFTGRSTFTVYYGTEYCGRRGSFDRANELATSVGAL